MLSKGDDPPWTPRGAPTTWRALLRRSSRLPAAVLVDRDGTIVKDVPYNGDPDRVEPMPGAAAAFSGSGAPASRSR